MTDAPQITDLSVAVRGSFARMEAQLRLRGWQSAVNAGRWDRAFFRLRGLADLYQPGEAEGAWTRLLTAGLLAAAHANSRGDASRFVRAVAPHSARLGMSGLREIFATCARLKHHALAEEIGAALAREWPAEPVGFFARADAAERRASERKWRPRIEWADDFRSARERGERLSASWQAHLATRWIVAHLRAHGARSDIRDALSCVSLNELPEPDAVWLAFGLAHSPHWLDQVKACDLVDARLDRLEKVGATPGPRLLDAVGALFEHLSPAPRDVVIERFERIAEHPSLAAHARAWREALHVRIHGPAHDMPLASAALDDLASGSQAALRGAIEGTYDTLDDSFLADLCRAIVAPTDESVDLVRRRLVTTPVPQWRAVAVAWQAWLDSDVSAAVIDRIGKAWCNRAAEPSYGWWSLALAFEEKKAREASRAAVWRGLHETPDREHDVRNIVVGRVVSRVVREDDVESLRRWLSVCEKVAVSTSRESGESGGAATLAAD